MSPEYDTGEGVECAEKYEEAEGMEFEVLERRKRFSGIGIRKWRGECIIRGLCGVRLRDMMKLGSL